MVTKWKSRILVTIWTFLFAFGISGVLIFFGYGTDYVYKDYFHTPEFDSEIDQFARYLSTFEIIDTTLEEAKKAITVTDDDIHEHRYRYGNLDQQKDNLKWQYEDRINEAEENGDKEVANKYIEERDAKIADITKNFESDDYVANKVRKEKEKELEKYYKEREQYRSNAMRYIGAFGYYFKNNVTGKVYTSQNPNKEGADTDNQLFLTNYALTRDQLVDYDIRYDGSLVDAVVPKGIGPIDGKIWVSNSLSSSNWLMQEYHDYKQRQILFLGYSLAGLIALILCFILAKIRKAIPIAFEEWEPYYHKIPFDLRIVLIVITGISVFFSMFAVIDWFQTTYENTFDYYWYIFVILLVNTFTVGLLFTQWKFLVPVIKSWSKLKEEWGKSLWKKAWQLLKVNYKKANHSIKEAFLHQSTGTQLFLVLGLVFVSGLGAIMIFVHPVFLLFYLTFLVVIGFPLVSILIKRTGDFNRIVEKSNELAAGKMGEDLHVAGESVLAKLAGNMNVLKQGVRQSQNEQAKSERLKTELITNVSHDLRTPLTSIISYTELLKKEDLSPEEKAGYLEIIDRKSQRLKVLIEDLFEVSKMASGNIELKKEKVDLVQLLQQALAEYDETINDSSLKFRVTNSDKPVYAFVDGQKLWRVFDNLIGNILKYSLDNSRVYISVKALDGEALISFKNISKYELNENEDELFERFKRGDKSRHTDGSGLGLAIAKSIVDLHEGSLDIDTDGDLFKVNIALRLVE